MKPCGIILFVYELFISESKSQVYGILHDVFSKWRLESIGRLYLCFMQSSFFYVVSMLLAGLCQVQFKMV